MGAPSGSTEGFEIVQSGGPGEALQNDNVDFFNNWAVLFALSFYGLPFLIASKFNPFGFHLLGRLPFEHVPKMARTVRLNPKIVNLKSAAIEYLESMVLEPVEDGFPFSRNNNVMTKFINHRAILQKVLRLPTGSLLHLQRCANVLGSTNASCVP